MVVVAVVVVMVVVVVETGKRVLFGPRDLPVPKGGNPGDE